MDQILRSISVKWLCGDLHIRLKTKASPGRDTNPCGVTSGRASGVKVCQIKHAELPAERRESESSQKLKVAHGVRVGGLCQMFSLRDRGSLQ